MSVLFVQLLPREEGKVTFRNDSGEEFQGVVTQVDTKERKLVVEFCKVLSMPSAQPVDDMVIEVCIAQIPTVGWESIEEQEGGFMICSFKGGAFLVPRAKDPQALWEEFSEGMAGKQVVKPGLSEAPAA